MEDSLEEQDIFVDQEYFWKSFFSTRLFCLRIKLIKRLLCGEVKGPYQVLFNDEDESPSGLV